MKKPALEADVITPGLSVEIIVPSLSVEIVTQDEDEENA